MPVLSPRAGINVILEGQARNVGLHEGTFLDCCFLRAPARVDPDSSSSLFDADHDIPRRAVAPLTRHQVRVNQRLVVSPVLTILTAILAVALISHALRTRNALLFVAALFLFFFPFFKIEYLSPPMTAAAPPPLPQQTPKIRSRTPVEQVSRCAGGVRERRVSNPQGTGAAGLTVKRSLLGWQNPS